MGRSLAGLRSESGLSAQRCPSESRHGWTILGVVALGTFMTALDASIGNIGTGNSSSSLVRNGHEALYGAFIS
jgi:hypothetical protein